MRIIWVKVKLVVIPCEYFKNRYCRGFSIKQDIDFMQ